MSKKLGVWINHRNAVIVSIEGEEEKVFKIESNIEKRVRLSGGARSATPYGPQEIVSDGKRDRKYMQHLDNYYEKVASAIQGAEAVIVFGPGEAKLELTKHLEKSKEFERMIKKVETTDKMTDWQLAAKVREYYFK